MTKCPICGNEWSNTSRPCPHCGEPPSIFDPLDPYDIPDYWDDVEDDPDPTCSEGFGWDECCGCVLRYGVESCEWNCPFTENLPRPCYTPECEKMTRRETCWKNRSR